MSASVPFDAGKADLRTIYLAPFGRHTRYMLAGYLRHVFVVLSVLLAIALTIDLWPQFQIIAGDDGHGAVVAVWNVLRFCALRTPGLVAPFLPFAVFLGVVWTEVSHSQSGERMLVWNCGRSPLLCLVPVVLLGVVLGAVEFALDGYLGPAAMAVQMQERFGLDGQRLDRTRSDETHWIASPGGLLRTEVAYGPPPVLRHVIFYRRDATGQLTEVGMADEARQIPGSDRWLMRHGRIWTPGATQPEDDAANMIFTLEGGKGVTTVPFATRTVALDLDPLWLSVLGMETQYLPMPVLRTLARSDTGAMSKGLYRTRLQVLYGEAVLPGAMALLAASLAMLFLAYRISGPALAAIIFAGYLAHFGTKACLMMGQNGYMPPGLAGWLVPGVLLAATGSVLLVLERRRRGVGRR
jgi:lipopolysaccharide export system permease protein